MGTGDTAEDAEKGAAVEGGISAGIAEDVAEATMGIAQLRSSPVPQHQPPEYLQRMSPLQRENSTQPANLIIAMLQRPCITSVALAACVLESPTCSGRNSILHAQPLSTHMPLHCAVPVEVGWVHGAFIDQPQFPYSRSRQHLCHYSSNATQTNDRY